NRYEVGNLSCYVDFSSRQVVILEKLVTMVDAKGDRTCNIKRCASANANDTVARRSVIEDRGSIHIGADRIFMDGRKDFDGDTFSRQVARKGFKTFQPGHDSVGHDQRFQNTRPLKIG